MNYIEGNIKLEDAFIEKSFQKMIVSKIMCIAKIIWHSFEIINNIQIIIFNLMVIRAIMHI